jgi:hypothetical protein
VCVSVRSCGSPSSSTPSLRCIVCRAQVAYGSCSGGNRRPVVHGESYGDAEHSSERPPARVRPNQLTGGPRLPRCHGVFRMCPHMPAKWAHCSGSFIALVRDVNARRDVDCSARGDRLQACAANYAWVNRSSMTFLCRQAFAKQFDCSPDDLDMHVVRKLSCSHRLLGIL